MPGQWHVTLRFLGEVDDPQAVHEAVSAVPVNLHVGRVVACLGPATAWFPDGRVLHIPVTGVETLADAVRDATARWGKHGGPAFAGHVTLARALGGDSVPAGLSGTPIAARFEVSEVTLFASSLGAEGATHEVVSKVPISAACGT
jgi:2'-5' RNA ligase